jgi:hypothetical protein
MSNQTTEQPQQQQYLQQEVLIANVKSGKWEYYIDHTKGEERKGSVQYRHGYRETDTKNVVVDKDTTIRALITMKNGPFTDKGQKLPKDIVTSMQKNEAYYKTAVEFGTKSCGEYGKFLEWFNTNIWPESVKTHAKNLGLDEPSTINVPFDLCKLTYGSKNNPGLADKREKYMTEKDWTFKVALRGDNKTGKSFGYNVFRFEKQPNGNNKKILVPIDTNNITSWFSRGNSGQMFYKMSFVTMNTNGRINQYYYGISAETFYIKRNSNIILPTYEIPKEEEDGLAEEPQACDNGPAVQESIEPQSSKDESIDHSTGPATSIDISNQLANLDL